LKEYTFDQGSNGESLVSNQLSLIFNGDVIKETMRGEGFGALDLQLKFKSNFPSPTFRQVAVQVKTGNSFGAWVPSKKRYRLQNIDPDHIEKWKASNQPVLLIWVKIDPQIKMYWKLITKKTPTGVLSVSENHLLTPGSRFEIERLLNIHSQGQLGTHKLITHNLSTTSEVREWAKPRFDRIKDVVSCCLGNVRISNYAWRHLTRITRPQSHIRDSLTVLPYVRNFLKATPHQIQTLNVTKTTSSGRIVINQKILAVYRDTRFSDKEICVVYVRLDEKIEFDTDWLESGMIKRKVQHDLRLESIFRKTSSKK